MRVLAKECLRGIRRLLRPYWVRDIVAGICMLLDLCSMRWFGWWTSQCFALLREIRYLFTDVEGMRSLAFIAFCLPQWKWTQFSGRLESAGQNHGNRLERRQDSRCAVLPWMGQDGSRRKSSHWYGLTSCTINACESQKRKPDYPTEMRSKRCYGKILLLQETYRQSPYHQLAFAAWPDCSLGGSSDFWFG